MTENQYPDPFGEAVHMAGRDVQQMFYAAAALTAAYVRYRSKAQQRQLIKNEQDRRAAQAQEQAERDATRARWAPANDRRWLRAAGAVDVAEAWAAAVPYADPAGDLYERSAELAADNCEARLRELHPYAMNRYDRLRADGVDRREAMYEAAPLFLNHPNARPQGPSSQLGLPVQGLGDPWIDQVRGPDREGFDQHVERQQTARGQQIVGRMQTRALAADRPQLDADEQRTALTNATNLPPSVIGQVVPPGPAVPRPARRPWENESPFSIEEVVAFAAAHPDALAHPVLTPDTARARAQERARHA